MSAWDITGALVWGALSVCLWSDILWRDRDGMEGLSAGERGTIWLIALGVTSGAIYCVARLCGAHA